MVCFRSRQTKPNSLQVRTLKRWLNPKPQPLTQNQTANPNQTLTPSYRDAEADIVSSLPAEAHLGLFRVDCRSLRQRMSESARRLADTVLLSLQIDAHHAAGEVIAKLQVSVQTLWLRSCVL